MIELKYIFLDIDGVLNSGMYYNERSQNERYKDVGYPYCDLDPKAILLLNQLVDETDAEIVVSSTWRNNRTVDELQAMLDHVGFKGTVAGRTPRLFYKENAYTTRSVPRGCEIEAWLPYERDHIRYVILDDDSDMLLWQRNNFFWIDGHVGLTPTMVYKIGRYLNQVG